MPRSNRNIVWSNVVLTMYPKVMLPIHREIKWQKEAAKAKPPKKAA